MYFIYDYCRLESAGACHSSRVEVRVAAFGNWFSLSMGPRRLSSSGQVLLPTEGAHSPGFCFKPHVFNIIKDVICKLKNTNEGLFIGPSKSFTWARGPCNFFDFCEGKLILSVISLNLLNFKTNQGSVHSPLTLST